MSILYSNAIFSFLKKAEDLAKQILVEEANLQVTSTRFFFGNIVCPLNFVVFEHPSQLGYFKSDFLEIGINKVFLFENNENLLNILRHELAHYFTFIEYGPFCTYHGKEFREICKRYGWNSEVSRAIMPDIKVVQCEKLMNKIHKLCSLAQSHHQHEAQAAILKVQKLLIKHNLDLHERDDTLYLLRTLPKKRKSTKMQAIASILQTFFVNVVFNRGYDYVYLELFGEKVNVEIAEYVAQFLDREFQFLWEQVKEENPQLQGMVAKNSFFRGLANGYVNKMRPRSQAALVKTEQHLVQYVHRIYPHLSFSRQKTCKNQKYAEELGKIKGENLKVHHGIHNQERHRFIDHDK